MRGGEKVLDAICELYPEPRLSTRSCRCQAAVSAPIERHRIKRSLVQRLPKAGQLYRQYLPLFPDVVELFDLDRYDLVISSSHCAAKSVIRGGAATHVCYCHSPMRYAWDQFSSYFGPDQVGRVPQPDPAPGAGAAGPVGCRHGRACRPLSRELSICCGQDPPIL